MQLTQHSSARNLSIVAHALACLPNVGAFGPSVPQPPNLTYLKKLQCTITCIFSVLEFCHFLKRGVGGERGNQKSYNRRDPYCCGRLLNCNHKRIVRDEFCMSQLERNKYVYIRHHWMGRILSWDMWTVDFTEKF